MVREACSLTGEIEVRFCYLAPKTLTTETIRTSATMKIRAHICALAALLSWSAKTPPLWAANSDDGIASKAVAYVDAAVLSPSGDQFRPHSTIIVHDGKIVAVGPSATVAVPGGAQKVQLNGRFIIPGLINSHVHLATLAVPGEARAYLRRELYSGITMVRDMAGDARLLGELKREASRDEIVAPDIYYAALFAGPSFFDDPRTHDASAGIPPGQAPWMQSITTQTDLSLAVARAKGTGATAIKIYADLPAPLVRAVTSEAHRQNMLVWSHAAVFPARPSEVVDAGVDVMSHADFIAFESLSPVPQTFQIAKQADLRTWNMTPGILTVLSKMKDSHVILDATVDVGYREPVPQWPASVATQVTHAAYQRGVAISTGTDDDADWNDPNSALLSEIERLVNNVGMTTNDALRAATVVGARTVGEQDTAGILAEGRVANFVVLEADPLQDIRNLHRVALVVKNGVVHRRSDYRPVTAEEMARTSREPDDPKSIVLAFYKLALQDLKPADAFARYAAPDFIEHSQDCAGGTAAATVKFLTALIARSPHPTWEIIRTVAEGDLVFLHARYSAGPGAPDIAVAELFRVRDGKLVEHWDVMSGPPDQVVNPNSRF